MGIFVCFTENLACWQEIAALFSSSLSSSAERLKAPLSMSNLPEEQKLTKRKLLYINAEASSLISSMQSILSHPPPIK